MSRHAGLALLLLFGGAALPAYGQVKLEWKFQEGDKFYVESTEAAKQIITSMGKTETADMTQTKVWSFLVKKAGPEPVLEQRIEMWTVKGANPFGGLPPKLPEKLKGIAFTLTLTPAGKITRFEGYDAVLKRLGGENEQMAKLLRTLLGEATFKFEAEELLNFLPDREVAKGDTWKNALTMPMGPFGAFKVENLFTYKGKEKEGERIDAAATLAYVAPKGDFGGLPLKVTKAEFKSDGVKTSLLFDAARGRLVRAESTMAFRGSLTLESGGNRTELSMDVRQTATTRVLDRVPEPK